METGCAFGVEAEVDVEAEVSRAEAETGATFELFRATLDVEADCGVGGLEFFGVDGRESFELKCLGVGGRDVLGVGGFELDGNALTVTGVERAIVEYDMPRNDVLEERDRLCGGGGKEVAARTTWKKELSRYGMCTWASSALIVACVCSAAKLWPSASSIIRVSQSLLLPVMIDTIVFPACILCSTICFIISTIC